jgi:hypothetical protein
MKSIIYIILTLFIVNLALAVEDCPIGLINDTAPGQCVLYTDKNSDNLCDLSQPYLNDSCDTNITATDLTSTEIKSMTVEQVAEYYNIEGEKFAKEISKLAGVTVKLSDKFQYLHDTYSVRPVNVREIAVSMKSNSDTANISSNETTSKQNYYVLPIVITLITLYVFTLFLSKKEIIKTITHNKIWNWLLLISFIPVLFSSLIWLLRAEFAIIILLPFNISYWHIIFGLIMIMISIFHLTWHIRYYTIRISKK